MPFIHEFDVANGLLQGRLYGRVTSEELKDFYQLTAKLVALKSPRAGISEMTGITVFEVTAETIRELARMRPAFADQNLLRVIVASSPDVYGMARMFESHGEDTRPNLHVVRTYKEALAIVGVAEPKFELLEIDTAGKAATE
jgi:hypothetical protein